MRPLLCKASTAAFAGSQAQHPTQSRQQKLWSQRKTPYASLAASPSRSCPEAHHTRPWREQTQTKPYSRKSAASEAFVTAELPPLPLPPTPAHRLQQEATKICRNAGARRGAVTMFMDPLTGTPIHGDPLSPSLRHTEKTEARVIIQQPKHQGFHKCRMTTSTHYNPYCRDSQ